MNTHTSAGSVPSGSHTTSPRMSVSVGAAVGQRHGDQRSRRSSSAAAARGAPSPAPSRSAGVRRRARSECAARRTGQPLPSVRSKRRPRRRAVAALWRTASRNGRRQERMVDEPAPAIVGHQRIDRLHFDAAEAGVVHRLQLAIEAGRRDGRAEPPPAHHRPRIGRAAACHTRRNAASGSARCAAASRRDRERRCREPPPPDPHPSRVSHRASIDLPPAEARKRAPCRGPRIGGAASKRRGGGRASTHRVSRRDRDRRR